MEFVLKPMRKADDYHIPTVSQSGLITVKGERSIGQFFFRTGKGAFCSKSNWDCALNGIQAKDYQFPERFVGLCLPTFNHHYGDVTTQTYRYEQDPGHGWVMVPVYLLMDLELQDQISRFSYLSRDGLSAWLEEDADMTRFHQAFETKFGQPPQYKEAYVNHTSIRDMAGYDVARFSRFLKADDNQTA